MATNQKQTTDLIVKGYILIPKQLLETELGKISRPLSHLEALLTLLAEVNYKNTFSTICGEQVICKRGEALFSTETWAEKFHWTRGKTRNFLHQLEKTGIIELVDNPHTTHVKVIDYELWTGCRTNNNEAIKTELLKQFEIFWDTFHLETNTRKRNRGKAERAWLMLTNNERKLAVENISRYFYSLQNTIYCKQAANYLTDKAFLDE